ncbi:MAG: fasciclin domain-containing protein [Drouetiella hepatica Uher 2000/2452]|jgi:uncharacterized surface protein with fasciclin (FAS1) repeats|uniref:Fasciclin domain-containing protein n=1 Tax=Drouetiella hepatica Uher 2000/2452 TaxID=904376 RepID=A0A951QEN9_9CYAN|nr:fasciclin domain-containing protein [Drouetiella hepatica Uher 2000/2452]
MATLPSLRLLQRLSMTGWVGVGLILAAPGFANSYSVHQSSVHQSDRLTSASLSFMPSVLHQAGLTIAQAQRQDIIDTAAAKGSFQTLLQLLDELGMTEDLRGYGRFTIFAPTDAAFAAIPPDVMKKLSDDRTLMSKVLAYHVISSANPLTSGQINPPASVRTLERSEVKITKRRGRLYVNEARIVEADIEATNGVIHAVDQVLIPDNLR